ncbi:interaptin isoform X2 [Parambassis ranga]|uniref:Interaptin isoform X2 n=1 Tax=Parambassis ranga TaxID=210632 RepID=A0A6P7IM39_9TELE|nr:interaptin-like isoform X2 [Parambassis ranga]
MFSPSCGSSSPLSLMDLDMWDTKSRFTAQTSAWCGSWNPGSGFMSKVSSGTGGFRQSDPGLRKWQSLSYLAPEAATRPFPSAAAELRAARGESSFRQAAVVQWLQDAHERIDTHLDRLKTRNSQLSAAQLLDMKHKHLSEAMSALEQKEAAELTQHEKHQKREELHEKVLKLEKDLLQMKSTLDRGSVNQPIEKAPSSTSRTVPVSEEDSNKQEKQKDDTELLREALKETEIRAKAQEEERNKALQHLHTSTETQRTLLNQIEEMNKKLSQTAQNHSEVQEQLCEANSKISQACLEKAILSTQIVKLEDNMKEMKARLTEALADKDHLTQEKADLLEKGQDLEAKRIQHAFNESLNNNNNNNQPTILIKEELKAFREVNEELRGELEVTKQSLEMSQCQVQELKEEKIVNNKLITELEVRRSQLLREKEELLSKMNEGGDEGLMKIKERCCQYRESVESLESENQKLQDQCLCLEAEVTEKEKLLHLHEEEYREQDAERVQSIKEMKAVVSHWTEKWQKVALTLQSTQEELEELKKNTRNDRDSASLLRAELDACKHELELERGRTQALLHRYKGGGAVETRDRETVTDLTESSLFWEQASDPNSHQNKSSQVCIQSSEVQTLKQKLAEREKELREKEHALKSLERLREAEKMEAQITISALELKLVNKVSEDAQQDKSLQADILTTDSLRAQLDECRRREDQLQQEKVLAVQKLQTLRQLYLVKDEKQPVESRKDKIICPVNQETEQQRRMVTEQLKSLFKEREEKQTGKTDNTSAAGASSPQDRTPTAKAVRAAVERRYWQEGSGLMPVLEEDEENDWTGGKEEGEPTEGSHPEGELPTHTHQT